MDFSEALKWKKEDIVQDWVGKVLASYAADGASFFNKEKDRFANPLGHAAKSGLSAVFSQLIGESSASEMPPDLRQFISLRSVQTFTPSEAVGFVYQLKAIIVNRLGQDAVLAAASEWFSLEARIDALALKIFDMYMEDRERLFQVKVNEYKKGNHIMAGGRCPSTVIGNKQEEKIELKVIREC